MALPTTNLTFHAKADVNTDVWKFYQSGTPYHNTAGADGDNIEVWDDADGKALALIPSVALVDGATYKTATPLMQLSCLDFNGSNEMYVLWDDTGVTAQLLSAILGAGAKTLIAAIYVKGVTSNAAGAWNNEAIFCDQVTGKGTFFGLHLRNTGSGYKIIAYNWGGSENKVELDILLNTSYVVTLRHDGTNLYISLNGGSESSVASTNTTDMTGACVLARSIPAFPIFFNGRIGEIAFYNAALTGTNLTDANSYFTSKWLAAAFQPHPPYSLGGLGALMAQ
jgi:hypothetical protein